MLVKDKSNRMSYSIKESIEHLKLCTMLRQCGKSSYFKHCMCAYSQLYTNNSHWPK